MPNRSSVAASLKKKSPSLSSAVGASIHLPPGRLHLPSPPSPSRRPTAAPGGGGSNRGATRIMAKSGARKEAAPARSSATSPPHHFPGAPASSHANPSPQPLIYPGASTSSAANPSTPPHLYPHVMETSSANPLLNTWYSSLQQLQFLSSHLHRLAITILRSACGVPDSAVVRVQADIPKSVAMFRSLLA
jgi:hypothetical protein